MVTLLRQTWPRRLVLGAAAAATTLAAVILLMPARLVPPTQMPHQDKIEHFALFAVLTLLWRAAGERARTVLLCAVALAVASEVAQAAMQLGRSGDPLDALADISGALLGLWLWRLIQARLPAT